MLIVQSAPPKTHPCEVQFFVGLHQISDAVHFDRAFISVNRLRTRKSDFAVGTWIMDSGAFTEINRHGKYRESVDVYAAQIRRWSRCGTLLAAVAQDYMCEPFILKKTGLTIEDHQRLTVERYDDLLAERTGTYILPVLQGYEPSDYIRHIRMYGDRLQNNMWVGVGSICKRNSNANTIESVLQAVKGERPDLQLHGFGIKLTSLNSLVVRECLHTADSMAWSFAARYEGRNQNDWREAEKYVAKVLKQEEEVIAQFNKKAA